VANSTGVNFDERSYQALLRRIETLSKDLQDEIVPEALEAGGEVIKDALEREIPKSALKKEHARAHIAIKRTRLKGRISIEPEKDFYYLIFPEFGTSSIVAQHNFERVSIHYRNEARKAIQEVIKRKLGLR
jgi:HK97 gp10 family phage protein